MPTRHMSGIGLPKVGLKIYKPQLIMAQLQLLSKHKPTQKQFLKMNRMRFISFKFFKRNHNIGKCGSKVRESECLNFSVTTA